MMQTHNRSFARTLPTLILSLIVTAPAVAQEWEAPAPLPVGRAQAVAAPLPDGRVLVAGGYAGNVESNSVTIYDPNDDSWETGAPMPEASRGAAACVRDGIVYVIGGFRSTHVATVQAFDPDTGQWELHPSLPMPGWELSCAVSFAGEIHVFGGEARMTRHDIYDPETRQYRDGAAIPDERQQHDSFTGSDGLIYLVGGGDSGMLAPDVLVYDPDTDQWTTGPPIPRLVRQYAGAATEGGDFLYVVGGSTAYGNNSPPLFPETYVFDVAAQEWTQGPSLPTGVREGSGAVVNGVFHSVGGSNGTPSTFHYSLLVGEVEGNNPPVLAVEPIPGRIEEGETVTLMATATDIDNDGVIIRWDLDGDGRFNDATGEVVEFAALDGEVSIELGVQARDRRGGTDEQRTTVIVLNLPPSFVTTPPTSVATLELYSYSFAAEDPAGEADPLTFRLETSPIGMSLGDDGSSLSWIPSPQQGDQGTHRIVLLADDGDGGVGRQEWTITVAPDGDGDGIGDPDDNCPDDANPDQADLDVDGEGDVCDSDVDGDSVENASDNCRRIPNADQADNDDDGDGDVCDGDDDNDFISDEQDNCPLVTNPGQDDEDNDGVGDVCDEDFDTDGDGIGDGSDNCPFVPNPDQMDSDADGVGDACDDVSDDRDNDGIPDADDNCPDVANPDQTDTDGDGLGDACDQPGLMDRDADGIADAEDNCPDDANADQSDTDGDGVGDACDDANNGNNGNNGNANNGNNGNNGGNNGIFNNGEPDTDGTGSNNASEACACQTPSRRSLWSRWIFLRR